MRRNDFSSLAVLLLALSTVFPARTDAQAPDQDSGMILERGSDGSFALPMKDRLPLRLEFDPAGSPIEIVGLSWRPDQGTIEAELQLTGDRSVSAWAVQTSTVSATGVVLSTTQKLEDWSFEFWDQPSNRLLAQGLHVRDHEHGPFYPYQISRIQLGIPVPAAADEAHRVVLSTPVAVYTDTSFTGSASLARKILQARKVAADELAEWSTRLDDAIAGVEGGPEALAQTLDTLRTMDAELAAAVTTLPPSAQAVRHNLHSNLEPVIRQAAASPGRAASALRDLADWVHDDLAARLGNVPATRPETPMPNPRPEDRAPGSPPSRLLGELGKTLECDCGGETIADVTRSEAVTCNVSQGRRVGETRDFHCWSAHYATGVWRTSGGRRLATDVFLR